MKLSTAEEQAVRATLTAVGVIDSDQDTSLAAFLRNTGDRSLAAWMTAHAEQRPIDVFAKYGSDAGRVASVLIMHHKGEPVGASDER